MRLDLRSLDLNALPKKMDYFVYFRGKIKERTYAIKGFEEIETPMGKFKALKISRDFPIGEEREQVYWFAPELDFNVVRILNNDGRKSDLILKTLEFID